MKITVADVDNIQDKSFKLHRPSGRAEYLFVLFKSPAKVMVDGEYIRADYGSFIIFDKYKSQSYFPCDNQPLIHDIIQFDLENDSEERIFCDIPKGTLLRSPCPDALSNILSEIKIEVFSTFRKYRSELLTNLGTAFLYRIKSELENADAVNVRRNHFVALYNLRLRLYRDPQREWSIETMSKEVCLSRSYFQQLYKRFFSVSCNNDIINARISYAKVLLLTDPLSVNEIAEKCGYKSFEHFIRQFKSKTGVSPQRFRGK